uniref:Uncharacterized protein n=1 Tax=Alexandrium andersonii TaxID=327968 RepID=A0A7S2BP88_9DINO
MVRCLVLFIALAAWMRAAEARMDEVALFQIVTRNQTQNQTKAAKPATAAKAAKAAVLESKVADANYTNPTGMDAPGWDGQNYYPPHVDTSNLTMEIPEDGWTTHSGAGPSALPLVSFLAAAAAAISAAQ